MQTIATQLAALALAAALGGLAMFFVLTGKATSAPQEAAASAMILAVVVPLYIIARCADMLANRNKGRDHAS